jgi:hypothetical protein
MYPELQDEWTDGALHANWTLSLGTAVTSVAGDNKVGSDYVKATGDKDLVALHTIVQLKFDFPEPINQGLHGQYDELSLYARAPIIAPGNPFKIRLCTDSTNYFETTFDLSTSTDWQYLNFPLGYAQTYGEDFPNGIWTAVNNPEWINLNYIEFYQEWDNQDETSSIRIDDLWFKQRRPRSTPNPLQDAASIAAYGQRDYEVVDDRLRTNVECTGRAQSLLWQKKDAPTQIEATVIGDTNLLVGDRLSVTLAGEGITAENYDLINVDHYLTGKNLTSKVVLVNSENMRSPIETNIMRSLIKQSRLLGGLATERKNIGGP